MRSLFCLSTVSSVDEYDYTTSERGPTYEYEEKVRTKSALRDRITHLHVYYVQYCSASAFLQKWLTFGMKCLLHWCQLGLYDLGCILLYFGLIKNTQLTKHFFTSGGLIKSHWKKHCFLRYRISCSMLCCIKHILANVGILLKQKMCTQCTVCTLYWSNRVVCQYATLNKTVWYFCSSATWPLDVTIWSFNEIEWTKTS